MKAEYWTLGVSLPGQTGSAAQASEREGWDGVVYVDSQNLRPDCFVAMSYATAATSTLKVSPGVTNPLTRHPATAASAIIAIHAESGGRASYGIGRGDSALAHLGLAPCSVGYFERYVSAVQRYVSLDSVDFETLRAMVAEVPRVDALHLKDQPDESRLRWPDPTLPKVTVEVVASGPQVIGVGARHADLVTFTVGADVDRIAWAMSTAREAAATAGRDPQSLRFGAYVNVAVHPDIAVARTLVSGGLASFSRFSAMHGRTTAPTSPEIGNVLTQIASSYDMKHHGEPHSTQTAVMTDEFVDRFGVVGTPEACVAKIRTLEELGVERLYLFGLNIGTRAAYPAESAVAQRLLVGEVLPALRLP